MAMLDEQIDRLKEAMLEVEEKFISELRELLNGITITVTINSKEIEPAKPK